MITSRESLDWSISAARSTAGPPDVEVEFLVHLAFRCVATSGGSRATDVDLLAERASTPDRLERALGLVDDQVAAHPDDQRSRAARTLLALASGLTRPRRVELSGGSRP
jgi:hypothetical protein